MTLSDLKRASAVRQGQEEPQQVAPAPTEVKGAPAPAPAPRKPRPAKAAVVPDSRTKMLGARVPLSIHREFQQHIFRAQEDYPDLTMQEAVPALIRLLRDDKVWNKFLAELESSE